VKTLAAADLLEDLALRAEMDELHNLAERLSGRAIELRQEIFGELKLMTRQPKGLVEGALR
ncbi:hypothetical protein LCGC14_1907770, partial [marine sediment metagenome]